MPQLQCDLHDYWPKKTVTVRVSADSRPGQPAVLPTVVAAALPTAEAAAVHSIAEPLIVVVVLPPAAVHSTAAEPPIVVVVLPPAAAPAAVHSTAAEPLIVVVAPLVAAAAAFPIVAPPNVDAAERRYGQGSTH